MASDNLNEVGRYIKNSGDAAERALKKQKPTRPSVERTRDIFDADIPFEMFFTVEPTQKSVSLDLEFNKPPPMSGCRTGSDVKPHCEEFTLPAGDHEIQLSHAAKTGSITVFVNGATYSPLLWEVISYGVLDEEPASIMVYQLPLETNTVSVCYIEPVTLYYTGSAFAELLASNDFGSGGAGQYLAFSFTGDNPGAGWAGYGKVGPVEYGPVDYTGGTNYSSIEVTASMVIRINLVMGWSTVISRATGATVTVKVCIVRGCSVVQELTEQAVFPGGGSGLSGWVSGLTLDRHDIEVLAGDKIMVKTVCGTQLSGNTGFLIGGYEAGSNGTWLRIGRGTHNLFQGIWTGP